MQHVEVEQVVEAPIETVWDRYTDHVSWTRWAGMGRVRLVREGARERNGTGCVREFSNLGFRVREEVLDFEPPRRMTYRVVSGGLPMREHLGEVRFEPCERGTRVVWRCRFEPGVPLLGGLLAAFIARLFRRALASLARQDLSGDAGRGAAAGA